jgi:hypothetical protein
MTPPNDVNVNNDDIILENVEREKVEIETVPEPTGPNCIGGTYFDCEGFAKAMKSFAPLWIALHSLDIGSDLYVILLYRRIGAHHYFIAACVVFIFSTVLNFAGNMKYFHGCWKKSVLAVLFGPSIVVFLKLFGDPAIVVRQGEDDDWRLSEDSRLSDMEYNLVHQLVYMIKSLHAFTEDVPQAVIGILFVQSYYDGAPSVALWIQIISSLVMASGKLFLSLFMMSLHVDSDSSLYYVTLPFKSCGCCLVICASGAIEGVVGACVFMTSAITSRCCCCSGHRQSKTPPKTSMKQETAECQMNSLPPA